MTDTHSKVSSYDDCHYKADVTDCENGNGKVTLLYTSYQATMEQWNGWNREHVWPQSLGGGNTTGGGADLHHVRPSDAGVNSSRGNKKYGESGNSPNEKYGSNPAVGVLGGTYNSDYFEPLDNVKGDVARICLYVYVRWGEDWGADSITEVFQSVDVLLEWCELDPVDTWEMGRNEVVQNIQGNRNVFIDYPELAWLLYEKEVPEGMITPSLSALDGELPTPPQGGGEGGNEGGEGGNEGGEGAEIPDTPVPEFPETERPFYNNIYYGDTLKFMFASPEKPSVYCFDGENNYTQLKIKPFVENGKQLTVYGYPVWISEQGMPLQNIGKRITVTVGDVTETYSVLEYVYTRLYVSTNTTPAEKHMHNTLIDYAKKADVVLNGVKESDIGTEYLVRVTNGTVDGVTASDLYKINDAPLKNIAPDIDLSDR
jgi:endonuclease I